MSPRLVDTMFQCVRWPGPWKMASTQTPRLLFTPESPANSTALSSRVFVRARKQAPFCWEIDRERINVSPSLLPLAERAPLPAQRGIFRLRKACAQLGNAEHL